MSSWATQNLNVVVSQQLGVDLNLSHSLPQAVLAASHKGSYLQLLRPRHPDCTESGVI